MNWQERWQYYHRLRTEWPPTRKKNLEALLRWPSAPHDHAKEKLYAKQGLEEAGMGRVETEKLFDKVVVVRQYIDQAETKASNSPRMEDVYHAAFLMLRQQSSIFCDNTVERGACFRGQTHTWPLRPKLYRDLPLNDRNAAQMEVERRTNEIALFSELLRHFVQSKYGRESSEAERVAIAQHYGLRTWMLDFTWDPWIALFFASWEGNDGAVGIVTHLSIGEVDEFSNGGRNLFGRLLYTELDYVPRIAHQKGLFLSVGHEELLDQYVPFSIEFNQHAGLVFEDKDLGVTRERLFPNRDVDPFACFDTPALDNPPPIDYDVPLTGTHYRNLVDSWIAASPDWPALDRNMSQLIDKLCDFHSRLQRYKEEIRSPSRSLHRLDDALARLHLAVQKNRPIPDLEEITNTYWTTAAGSDEYVWVRRAFDECR